MNSLNIWRPHAPTTFLDPCRYKAYSIWKLNALCYNVEGKFNLKSFNFVLHEHGNDLFILTSGVSCFKRYFCTNLTRTLHVLACILQLSEPCSAHIGTVRLIKSVKGHVSVFDILQLDSIWNCGGKPRKLSRGRLQLESLRRIEFIPLQSKALTINADCDSKEITHDKHEKRARSGFRPKLSLG